MVLEKNSKEINNLINLYKCGKLIDAEKMAGDLIKKNPDSYIVYNILGIILDSQRKYMEALHYFHHALKIESNYAQAENNLGVTYQKLNKLDKAIFHYKKAINIKKDFIEALNNLGIVLKRIGQYDEAALNFKEVLKINPDHTNAKEGLGSIFLQLGKYIEGLEMISQGTGFVRFNKEKKIEIINTLNNA